MQVARGEADRFAKVLAESRKAPAATRRRLYLEALATLLPLPLLYPLSIFWYWGQLTDPVSHALFVLALIYIVEDRWLELAGALALGVMAKETAVILVPAYWACWWRKGPAA